MRGHADAAWCRLMPSTSGRVSRAGKQQRALKRMRKLRDDGLPLRTIAERMQTLGISIPHMGVKTALRGMVR
jgi:hypothetical protein